MCGTLWIGAAAAHLEHIEFKRMLLRKLSN